MSDLLSAKTPKKAVTAADMNLSLARHFAHPVYGIVFEVAKATGYGAGRHIDALVMGLWPSRGMELVAIEVKVSRADFRRELQQPQKAEELAQFCDRFYIAAPAAMIPVLELPPNWGLLERTDAGAIRESKPAVKLEAKAVTRNLLAAVFRAASRPNNQAETAAALLAQRQEFEETIEAKIQQRLKYTTDSARPDAEKWRALCAELGENSWMDNKELLHAVKVLRKSGIANHYRGVRFLQSELGAMLKRLNDAAEMLPAELVGTDEKIL